MNKQEMLEKVIKGLECCILGNKHEPDCDICPYSAGCNDTCYTMDEIHGDALMLLKAQEPVAPVEEKRRGGYFRCGNCNARVSKVFEDKYCSQCGRAVKWE